MTAVDTTTTTTTTTATQSGVQLVVGSQSDTQSVGSFVTDVTIQPYINPRIISFFAYNMRPNALIHVFFDSVLVDQYCAPGVVPNSIADTSDYTSIAQNGAWGTPIYVNSLGEVAGQFSIPAATFKTGDRTLELADVTSLALGNNAITTTAIATFTASDLNVTKSAVTLTTVNPTFSVQPVTNTVITVNTVTTNTVLPDQITVVNNVITNTQTITVVDTQIVDWSVYQWDDPIAQGFTINTPQQQSGIFATSIDLFFNQKSLTSNTNGVTVYICQIDNGYPNTNCILPFSSRHLPWSNVATSNIANVSTNFMFESPVFLNNGEEYAFVVKPDNNDPDYQVWTANVGDVDVTTGFQVYTQPIVGTAFYGATTTEWTALQTEYIKFNLNRASFTVAQGDAYFNNGNTDYIYVSSITFTNTTATIMPGDYVYQATNSTPSTANTSINGRIEFFDTVRDIFYIANSTGNFTANSFVQVHRFTNASLATSPNTTTLIASSNTGLFYNPVVDALVPQLASITPPGTALTFGYTGTSNAYVLDTAQNTVTPGYETEFFDEERIVASRTNEVVNMSGNKSFTLHANLITDSSYISPLIDTARHQELVIANQIDPVGFNYFEFYNYSNTKSKYVSQIVTLAQGQDAQDINISITAHRPPQTDITVWVKFLNGEDADSIQNKIWTPLINLGSSLFSDPSNPQDFKEFNFVTASAFNMFTTTGTITANISSPIVTGSGTLFGSQVQVGYWLTMMPNATYQETPRQVVSITNSTSLVLSGAFGANYSGNSTFIQVPPQTAYMSQTSNSLLTGTVTTSISNNAIVGSGTNFTGQLLPGQIISVANDEQVIVSIANSTLLTVGTAWSSAASGANAYLMTPAGITYLNSNNALFTTYKQFQIKIVLQSNNSARVPLMDDLRVLALQL